MKRYRHYLKKILYICLVCVMLFALVKGIGLPSENGRLPIGWLAVLDDTWEVERENVQDKKVFPTVMCFQSVFREMSC